MQSLHQVTGVHIIMVGRLMVNLDAHDAHGK
jgi:hypothetical protein